MMLHACQGLLELNDGRFPDRFKFNLGKQTKRVLRETDICLPTQLSNQFFEAWPACIVAAPEVSGGLHFQGHEILFDHLEAETPFYYLFLDCLEEPQGSGIMEGESEVFLCLILHGKQLVNGVL
jgi:hypothetical protein